MLIKRETTVLDLDPELIRSADPDPDGGGGDPAPPCVAERNKNAEERSDLVIASHLIVEGGQHRTRKPSGSGRCQGCTARPKGRQRPQGTGIIPGEKFFYFHIVLILQSDNELSRVSSR
jgi:hypothetical protein